MSVTVYRDFSQEALDQAYDNRRAVPGHARYREEWTRRSDAVYARVRVERDIAYGAGPRQRLDFLHCGAAGRPTFAYIHGGYWQWNDKETHAFVAAGLLAQGVNVVLVEYTLAPAARMDAIAEEARMAMRWLLPRLAPQFGAAQRLAVGGHSAGGHLSAIALQVAGLAGGLLVSGLYDLEPIQCSYLNDAIGMDRLEARRNSPLLAPAPQVPACVTVGAAELPELRRQSAEYAAHLRAGGSAVEEIAAPGDDHFSILERLAAADGALCAAVLRLLDRGPRAVAAA
jgi:acetyl esterase/lipase